jgi:hypothetical protein
MLCSFSKLFNLIFIKQTSEMNRLFNFRLNLKKKETFALKDSYFGIFKRSERRRKREGEEKERERVIDNERECV